MWNLTYNAEKVNISYMATLSRHAKAVNVVRFSPDGMHLSYWLVSLARARDVPVLLLLQANFWLLLATVSVLLHKVFMIRSLFVHQIQMLCAQTPHVSQQ